MDKKTFAKNDKWLYSFSYSFYGKPVEPWNFRVVFTNYFWKYLHSVLVNQIKKKKSPYIEPLVDNYLKKFSKNRKKNHHIRLFRSAPGAGKQMPDKRITR